MLIKYSGNVRLQLPFLNTDGVTATCEILPKKENIEGNKNKWIGGEVR